VCSFSHLVVARRHPSVFKALNITLLGSRCLDAQEQAVT
jgi:hypothetical protein